QAPLAIISLSTILFGIFFIRTKKIRYIFFSAFFASLGSSIHLQGAELGIVPIIALILSFPFSWTAVPILFIGFIIPWLPVVVVDSQNHFANSRNMLNYFLHDQYKVSLDVLGRNWK